MPRYEYQCISEECNHEIIIDCKMSEYSPIQKCEKCESDMVRKVENMVCGMSIDKTGSFYRAQN